MYNSTIGNRNLIIRWLPPETYNSADLAKKIADTANEIAAKIKPHKMRVGYHNHTTDFNRLDGEYWWNLFADRTSKDVMLQFDTGNASEMAGVRVVDVIRRNPGRIVSMHVKPFSKTKADAFIGQDDLPWADIIKESQAQKIEYYIIEYEREGVPPLVALKANLEAFRKLRS